MDYEKLKSMKFLLKGLRRKETENFPSANVAEAIDLLIECMEFIFDSYQPERLNPEDAIKSVSDSLNLQETVRERSEEISPPTKVGHEK